MVEGGGAPQMLRRPAIWYTSTFGDVTAPSQPLAADNSGTVLVRRFIAALDHPTLLTNPVGPLGERVVYDDYDVAPMDQVPVNETVIVNMDVLDSPVIHRMLKKSDAWHFPSIVNFVWWNVSEYSDPKQRAMIGWSCGMFPTICNSPRTGQEILAEVRKWCGAALADMAQIEVANLGIELGERPERVRCEVPVVWYPSTWLFGRKRPERFLHIVDRARAVVPFTVEMALNPRHLGEDRTAAFRERSWIQVTPMADRWLMHELHGKRDVFVASAIDESYGLAYLEALWDGVVGLFPDLPWARAILPPEYPLFYGSPEEGAAMLTAVLKMEDRGQRLITPMREFIRQNHDAATFGPRVKSLIAQMGATR